MARRQAPVMSISSTSLPFPFLSTFVILSQSYRHEVHHLPYNLTFAGVWLSDSTFPSR
ncbi:hypothetical protein BDZ91DRAFT_731086 [Kalaharituber pfeilii]|nr:hypothetical protein BDZ91DRAFT_731086 [Kalaharituber pfeilii]